MKTLEQTVAFAIAKVQATHQFDHDPRTRDVDGLSRVTAIQSLAEHMAPHMIDEALAAIAAAKDWQALQCA